MTAPVDISREACEREAKTCGDHHVAAMLLALHAALDAAVRERAQWRCNSRENKLIAESNLRERDAADATGYARGVRDAAAILEDLAQDYCEWSAGELADSATASILALLPAEKEATP